MSAVIRVENLGKRYRLGLTHAGSIRELVARATDRLLGRRAVPLPRELGRCQGGGPEVDQQGYFWALRDVSFEVQPGEVLGIIGRNGAGKSTLLKILSRITPPTEGRAEIRGRVGSLLEVGTGFHPELTGRENIFLNGAILGMTRGEIRRKFDEIVAFAEIEEFIETPVKRYSSGMYVRLAFAVAAHLQPEILLVDEVLAVGDAEFQRKCLGKMEEVSRLGRSVLFVSHQMGAIESLTRSCLLLERGGVGMLGPTAEVVARYLQGASEAAQIPVAEWPERCGDRRRAAITGFSALNAQGETSRFFRFGEPLKLRLQVDYALPTLAEVALSVENARNVPLFTTLLSESQTLVERKGRVCYQVTLEPNHLKPGTYLVNMAVGSGGCHLHDAVLHYPGFTIQASSTAAAQPPEMRWGDLIYDFPWHVDADGVEAML